MKENNEEDVDNFKSEKIEIVSEQSERKNDEKTNSINDDNNLKEEALIISNKEQKSEDGN